MSWMNIIAVMSLVVGTVMTMDQDMKDYILKLHNEYRLKQGATDMAKLEWDAALESEALEWANVCQYKHKGMGENLAWNSMTDTPEKELIDKAMKAFYDEIQRYSYGQNSCGSPAMACHYTQLVWAKTVKVGCASRVCEPLTGAYKKAWYLVCRYDPAGNWNGEKPFKKGGAPCSACNGAKCDAGLCIGGAVEAPKVCKDDNPDCAEWAGRGECKGNPGYMEKSCQKSCGVCT